MAVRSKKKILKIKLWLVSLKLLAAGIYVLLFRNRNSKTNVSEFSGLTKKSSLIDVILASYWQVSTAYEVNVYTVTYAFASGLLRMFIIVITCNCHLAYIEI